MTPRRRGGSHGGQAAESDEKASTRTQERICQLPRCGRPLTGKIRSHAIYCSNSHKTLAWRDRKRQRESDRFLILQNWRRWRSWARR